MRRISHAIGAGCTVVAIAVLAVALARSSGTARHNPVAAAAPGQPRAENITRYQSFGGRYDCRDQGTTTGGRVRPFTLPPAARTYQGTITVSFSYRAYGRGGAFSVVQYIDPVGGPKPPSRALLQPSHRTLPATNGPSNATVVMRVSDLYGGTAYWIGLQPRYGGFCLDKNGNLAVAGINITHVVYSVQVSPS